MREYNLKRMLVFANAKFALLGHKGIRHQRPDDLRFHEVIIILSFRRGVISSQALLAPSAIDGRYEKGPTYLNKAVFGTRVGARHEPCLEIQILWGIYDP